MQKNYIKFSNYTLLNIFNKIKIKKCSVCIKVSAESLIHVCIIYVYLLSITLYQGLEDTKINKKDLLPSREYPC